LKHKHDSGGDNISANFSEARQGPTH
jgi:hypothetical protein